MHHDFHQQASIISKAIISSTYTKNRANFRIRMLKQYLESYFFDRRFKEDFNAISEFVISTNEISDPDDQSFVKNIESQYVSFFEKKSFYDLLSAVRNDIFRSPRLTLYLSTILDEETLKQIGQWCRINVDPEVLIAIRYTKAISAGCGINWKMKYHELSFETLFEAQRGSITSLVKNYATD